MIEGQKLLPEWDWRVDVEGVENPELAETLAHDTREMIYLLSASGFDLRTLDGVTIASDYATALSQIDRGLKCQSLARPTNENGIEGVAMAVGILRQGRQRTHLVLTPWIPCFLRSKNEAKKRQAFGAIAHEAAHIHFAAKLESKIPNVYGDASSLRQYPPAFQSAALHLWDEYAATRMSGYIDPDATEGYRENISTLIASSAAVRSESIAAYRRNGDYERLFLDLSGFVERLLCSFAYLLGHLDSLDQQLLDQELLDQDLDPSFLARIVSAAPAAGDSIRALQHRLRALWETQDLWTSIEVFSPLCDLFDELLRGFGVGVSGYGDRWGMSLLDSGEPKKKSGSTFDWTGVLLLAPATAASLKPSNRS